MNNSFHRRHLITIAALVLSGLCGIAAAQAGTSQYYGRWTVYDHDAPYSGRGIPYRTLDIAPCGGDFCAVSVSESGKCGSTMFRFFTTHADDEELTGHGKWGVEKKKLIIGYHKKDVDPESVYLGLGADDMDFTGREGSIPTFEANYHRDGDAQCMTN